MNQTRIAFTAAAALLLAWLVVWTAHVARLDPGDGASVYRPEGYVDTVELFLRHGWLDYDRLRRRIALDADLPVDSPAARFYRESYLERDVAAFNNGDPGVFRIENGLIVGIDPNRHNIPLAFSEVRQWHGSLTFRPEDVHRGELVGRDVRVELIGPSRSLIAQGDTPVEEVRLASQRRSSARRSSSEQRLVADEAVNFFSDSGIYFGKAHLVGDAIIFNRRGASADAEIFVSGDEVPQGNHFRLDPGDLLKLQWRFPGTPRQYALLWSQVSGAAPLISTYRSVNGRWQRTPESVEPRLMADIVLAMDVAFQRREGEGGYEIPEHLYLDTLELSLTLDQTLQQRVQEELLAYCRDLRQRGEPPFRAAVTVMDAASGEILALASYPAEKDLEGWRDSSTSRNRLLRNHNFARLPIGSVAKVIFTAGIVQAAPQLAELEIRGYAGGELEQLLGISLSQPLKDHSVWGGGDQRIDFEEFIEQSSNRYAVTLLTLSGAADRESGRLMEPRPGLPDRLEPEQTFYVGGRLYERRPYLRSLSLEEDPEDPERVRSRTLNTLEHEPHALAIRELFDVAISVKSARETEDLARRSPGAGDDLIDTSLWLPLLELLYGLDDVPRYHPFYGVAPERENLAYNLINDYRRQYLSAILGGASSVWTNPKVCEIFSRLVTGRKIERQLVRRLRTGDGEIIEPWSDDEPAALPMKPELRARLVNAMTRVASVNGTASRLHGALRELMRELPADEALGFFSKTGSPTNLSFVPAPTAQAVNELIREGALALDASGRIAYRGTGPVEGDEVEGRPSPTLRALTANAGDMEILRRHGVAPRTVMWVCDNYNDQTPDVREQLFAVEGGRLVRMKRFNRAVRTLGGAYAFTIGLYDAAAARPRGGGYLPEIDVVRYQPKRALSVSIVVENQGTGPDVAVPLASRLLEEALWEALREGW